MNKFVIFGAMFSLFIISASKSEAFTEENSLGNSYKGLGTTQRSIFDPREEDNSSNVQNDEALPSENGDE